MADKAISELIAANQVTPTDLFVLEQSGTAKKLTGQTLENWLVSFADGHGGIQSIAKVSTSGLVDTYRITLADTTTFDFVVNNGRGISGITKTATKGLVDTYTISYNDSTSATFTVTNGEKGDKGDNQYIWIKYASQEPTASSHSFGDVADNWIGIYSGDSATAPTDWQQYTWFEIKGAKGDKGEAATLTSSKVEYQASDSGSIIPSGVWSESVPAVAQGRYLWTRTTQNFNTGSPVVAHSVSRMGMDGSGSVSSVANISPDASGNVPLTAEDLGAMPLTESAEHPGCYYRTVGSGMEWLNPPMLSGVEYRLLERYNGKPMYAYSVNVGDLPASDSMSFTFGAPGTSVDELVSMDVFAVGTSDRRYKFPFINTSGQVYAIARTTGNNTVYIHVYNDISSYAGHAFFKYTKK